MSARLRAIAHAVRPSHIAALLCCACSAIAAQPGSPGGPSSRYLADMPAVVKSNSVLFRLPIPYRFTDVPKPPKLGYYVWRIDVESALNSGISIVMVSKTPVATSDFAKVVKEAVLLRCPDTHSTVPECKTSFSGRAELKDLVINLEINEFDIVQQLRKERPGDYWRTLYQPAGRFVLQRELFTY